MVGLVHVRVGGLLVTETLVTALALDGECPMVLVVHVDIASSFGGKSPSAGLAFV